MSVFLEPIQFMTMMMKMRIINNKTEEKSAEIAR